MYGCYKIKFLDKNRLEKKSIYQKNSITSEGKKKILDMLSYNLSGSYGYKIAKNDGYFFLNEEKINYYSSFFNWGEVSHPFNTSGNYKTLPESEIAKQVLTENENLNENQADRVLNHENKKRVEWGLTNSQTSGSNNGYDLSSYKTWFNIGIGMVDQEEIFELPFPNEENDLIDADNGIKLIGCPIYKKSVSVISVVIPNSKPYTEGEDYKIDYDNGVLTIIENDKLRGNISEIGEIKNQIKITYTWNAARYIDELKNGICGVYVNAQPSMKLDSSSSGNNYYFGMGTFSCDNGKSWSGYSFPWKGLPLENININSIYDARAGMNMTGFFSSDTEFDHYFPTFPYTFVNPTNFAFAFCTNGTNSFQIRNLNFLVPDFPTPTINEIAIVSFSETIKKQVEWCGIGKEEEEEKYFAEWKMYLNADEGNGIEFKSIESYFSKDDMKDLKDGWNEMQYPEYGDTLFSSTQFLDNENKPTSWKKSKDEVVEISYRVYFE